MSSFRIALGLSAAVLLAACGSTTETPRPTTLVVTPNPVTFTALGSSQPLTVVVKDQHEAAMTLASPPTFTTHGATVAQVTSLGNVSAVGAGSTTITVAASGLTTDVNVTVTQVPVSMSKTAGDNQTGEAGQPLPTRIRLRVADANAAAIPGATVAFAVMGGGSVSAPTAISDANGSAEVTWTLGTAYTPQSLIATVGTVPAVTFTATSVAPGSLPRTITPWVGDNQIGLVGVTTNMRPAVQIATAAGPVAGVNVTFAVTSGGGAIVGNTVIATNAQGIAQVQGWQLGGSPGTNRLTATAEGTSYSGGVNTVSFNATGQYSAFNIVLRNVGPAFSPPVQAAFDQAVSFWQNVIIGDQPNIDLTGSNFNCNGNTINELVDDILIYAKIDTIDGPGQILGQAGPCAIRNSNAIPLAGIMTFDSADVANMVTNGTVNSVILHEMGHVLGFTYGIWNINTSAGFSRSCLSNPTTSNPGPDTYFNCPFARIAFDSMGGTGYTSGFKVPLENCVGAPASCGAGTYNSHWRETVFGNELMTGYVNAGTNPFSVLTIAAMQDLGYAVNYTAAQSYTPAFSLAGVSAVRLPTDGSVTDLGDDVTHGPIAIINRSGRVVGVIR